MKAFRVLIVLALLSCCVSIAAQAPPNVEGVVMAMGSNTPLSNATLDLRGIEDSNRRFLAVTSGTGQFAFRNVPPGNYTLIVAHTGYLQAQYGQRGPNGPAGRLAVPAGQRVTGVRIAMMRAASISGRVYDRDGAPAVNAQLHAWKISYSTGWRMAIPVTSQMTNDRGEYRLFGMPPGVYYVSAQPEPPLHIRSPAYASRAPIIPGSVLAISTGGMFAAIPDPAFARPGRQEWAPVYYGGTTDEYLATPIYLRGGADLSGIDVIVNRLPVGILTGIVTGPDSLPVAQAAIVVAPTGNHPFHTVPQINVSGGVMSISVAAPARSNTMGQFRIGPLSPGSYTLMAMSATPNGPRLSGYTNVSVQGIDPVNVTISMSPVLELDGRFVFDETPAASSINVRARSTISTQADSAAVAPSPDGTVKLTGIGRGPYVIDVASLPQDHFLKSARLGDVDVLTDGFRMENPPDRAMDIVVSSKGAMLRGLVRDSGRNAAGGVVVTLVPDEVRRQRQELFRNVTADAAGRYEFRGIPPGSYKVFAWEDIEPKSWLEPAYLRVFEDLGKVVAVAEGSSETLDIIAISPLER